MKNFFISENGQMSETAVTLFFITLSGGLQDAYTYIIRGGTFANAQTGNIVLMSDKLFTGNVTGALKYCVPVTAFAFGIFVSSLIRYNFKQNKIIHWRQIILLIEIVILFLVAFIPQNLNNLANAAVSFACAMQVETFQKINTHSFASTMCIGNLKSGVEAMSMYICTKNRDYFEKAEHYIFIILSFALGAGLGSFFSFLTEKLIILSCVLLSISFFIMFIDKKQNSR